MTRFMVSMPEELLKQLDRLAKREHRSRSELLREAARRYLNQPAQNVIQPPTLPPRPSARGSQRWTSAKLTKYLLDKGVVTRGCPGLEALLGPIHGPVDMEKVLAIGKKLTGLSQQIIADREDRL